MRVNFSQNSNFIPASDAVHCYKCDSTTSTECNDLFDKSSATKLIIDCDDPSFQPDYISLLKTINRKDLMSYCTKTEIISNDELITSRNCGFSNLKAINEGDFLSKILVNKLNVEVEDQCSWPMSGHPILSYCTCSSSLCNGSRVNYSRFNVGFLVVLVGFLCFVRTIWGQ